MINYTTPHMKTLDAMGQTNPVAAEAYIHICEDEHVQTMNDNQIRRTVLRIIREINRLPSLVLCRQCRARPRSYRTRTRRSNKGATGKSDDPDDPSDICALSTTPSTLSLLVAPATPKNQPSPFNSIPPAGHPRMFARGRAQQRGGRVA